MVRVIDQRMFGPNRAQPLTQLCLLSLAACLVETGRMLPDDEPLSSVSYPSCSRNVVGRLWLEMIDGERSQAHHSSLENHVKRLLNEPTFYQ